MSNGFEKVRNYYNSFDEWARLDTPAGQIEFVRTLSILKQVLKPTSRVLDLGGGPGRYAIALAKAGHKIALADLSEVLIETARKRINADAVAKANVESISVANATNLSSFESNSFDAVLALGPFYHLTTLSDRQSAASEIARVLKPGGAGIVAYIPKLSGLAGLLDRAATSPNQVTVENLQKFEQDNIFHNASSSGFQEGFYPTTDEMVQLLEARHLKIQSIVSTRSFANGRESHLIALRETNRKLFEEFMALIETTQSDASAIAFGGHALLIAKKA